MYNMYWHLLTLSSQMFWHFVLTFSAVSFMFNKHTCILIFWSILWHVSPKLITGTSFDVMTCFGLKLYICITELGSSWVQIGAYHIFHTVITEPFTVNTLRPRQNGCHFADDTFKRIFLNQNVRNSIKISPKFVPKGRIHNIPSLVQIMAWRRPGDKPLSEPMIRLLTHICVTRPQWVNK